MQRHDRSQRTRPLFYVYSRSFKTLKNLQSRTFSIQGHVILIHHQFRKTTVLSSTAIQPKVCTPPKMAFHLVLASYTIRFSTSNHLEVDWFMIHVKYVTTIPKSSDQHGFSLSSSVMLNLSATPFYRGQKSNSIVLVHSPFIEEVLEGISGELGL